MTRYSALLMETVMIRIFVAAALALSALSFVAVPANAGDGNDYRPGQMDGRY